jgi:hypothetical protein
MAKWWTGRSLALFNASLQQLFNLFIIYHMFLSIGLENLNKKAMFTFLNEQAPL